MTVDPNDPNSPMSFVQQSFIGGINQQVDSTRIGVNEFPLLINARNRYDTIDVIKLPAELLGTGLPANEKFQGIYSAGVYLLAFVGGKAYYRNTATSLVFNRIATLQLDPTVDTIYACAVPVSSNNFSRKQANGNTDVTLQIQLVSAITQSKQGVVVQDGINQPWIINDDATARILKSYNEWDNTIDTGREYVPIGTLMIYQSSRLYIVNGNQIYRSVSGRPLDFMVNIKSNGDKGGDANTVSYAVDRANITCISNTNDPNGGFFVSTLNNSYMVYTTRSFDPTKSAPTLFGEPTFDNIPLFATGAVNQFSYIDILGDSALIDFTGIKSFNAVLQAKNEGRNLPFYAKIANLFKGKIQSTTCAINYDDYGVFAVNTIFGPAVMWYDTINKNFSSIDLYPGIGTIKQFAEVKFLGARKLFFITTDNKIFEAFGSTLVAQVGLYAGEWCSNIPNIEQDPQNLYLVFINAKTAGQVYVTPYVDRLKQEILYTNVDQNDTNLSSSNIVPPFGDGTTDTVRNVSIPLNNLINGWKIGFFIQWNFEASLSHIGYEAAPVGSNCSSQQAGDIYRLPYRGDINKVINIEDAPSAFVFLNTEQTYTAICPDGSNNNVATVAAGLYTSRISQTDADNQALTVARNNAVAGLVCTAAPVVYYNVEQSYTAYCPSPLLGNPITATVAAGTIQSVISQADADAQALAIATQNALSALVCNAVAVAPIYDPNKSCVIYNGLVPFGVIDIVISCVVNGIVLQGISTNKANIHENLVLYVDGVVAARMNNQAFTFQMSLNAGIHTIRLDNAEDQAPITLTIIGQDCSHTFVQ